LQDGRKEFKDLLRFKAIKNRSLPQMAFGDFQG
jgi:hypothetical protein